MFEPVELVQRLAALVPAARGHLVRTHGVLAAGARWRRLVVRDRSEMAVQPSHAQRSPSEVQRRVQSPEEELELRERRLTWAQLLQRVFLVDILECPRCRGRRKLIAVIADPAVAVRILESLGLPTRAPPRGRAVSEEQGEGWGPGEADPVWE